MADGDSYIILNVGGICYTTSRLTLTSRPDSMLSTMFSEDGVPPQPDKNGHFFIDRDGAMFRYILNFMRDGRLCLPSSFEEYDQLLAEAEFFQLSALKEEISSRMKPAEVSAGKEVVMLKTFLHKVDTMPILGFSVPPEYSECTVVAAQKQTWAKLRNLARVPSSSDLLKEGVCLIFEGYESRAYDLGTSDIIFDIIRDGFKLELTDVSPGHRKSRCFIFSLDHQD